MSIESLVKGPSRVALIRERYLARNGAQITELLPVSRREIRAEAQAVARNARDDSSVVDEEIQGFSPTIAEENVEIRVERESDILLSLSERRQLKKDLLARRMQYAIVLRSEVGSGTN